MERTPDDPNDEPTRMADYDYRGPGNYDEPAGYYGELREPAPRPGWPEPVEPPPTPWYLRPLALIGWGVLTALLIALLVWSMVRLVNKDSGDTPPATTVTSTTTAPGESPAAPSPAPVAPDFPTDEGAPPATTTESPASSSQPPTTTTAPTTTEPPSTTAPTTTQAPTTTTAPPTTTSAAAQPPSEIVIPLPPGL